jgi:hypothetical protein
MTDGGDMTRIATIVLLLGLVLSSRVVEAGATAPGIAGANPEQVDAITWAIQRYAEAGLELPALAIVVHPTSDGCGGNRGQYHIVGNADVVDLCDTSDPVILHELAHAWAAHQASDQTKAAFLAFEGLQAWSGSDIPYDDRGTEHAAQTMSLCLAERPLTPIDAGRYANYLEGYEILTGMTSPRVASTPAGD